MQHPDCTNLENSSGRLSFSTYHFFLYYNSPPLGRTHAVLPDRGDPMTMASSPRSIPFVLNLNPRVTRRATIQPPIFVYYFHILPWTLSHCPSLLNHFPLGCLQVWWLDVVFLIYLDFLDFLYCTQKQAKISNQSLLLHNISNSNAVWPNKLTSAGSRSKR